MATAPTIEELIAEEDAHQLAGFDYELAWRLGCAIRETAAARSLPIAIEISHHGTAIFSALLPGASPDNLAWVRRKRAVVERFNRSSLYMRLLCERNGTDFHARYRLPAADFAASGGGVPVRIRNVGIVGTVAISGLPDVEDHTLAMRSLENLA
ncbi:heme-degrading domain-containing protein [Phyllobacterium sp. 21LDTY02-6]|uniref:heme-degrading domain-containing protein n=1 Tax=Phyllobacterium sp. 21LDTY02-6 TaxID=2944903 RepID=UPI0020213557|nr:heme-degrading domain-containing protein [Phyllobacterium sp. 21LDTY02-6]MCO4318580.1 heme-degrading domain-containing protein [Phyllobacterium sp. 21LDTY02-6]